MKVILFLAIVASTTAIWPWNSQGTQQQPGTDGNQGGQGLLGGIGDLLNPITGTVSQLLQQVLSSLKSIVDDLSKLLGASLNDIKGAVNQLLNPDLSLEEKQKLVQTALKNVQEPVKSKAQQVATALINVSNQLKNQSAAVRKAVSEIVTLAFDQQFRQLPLQQQQTQLQNILKGLSQVEQQALENVLNTFKGQIGQANRQ